jgi:hypothetical protein
MPHSKLRTLKVLKHLYQANYQQEMQVPDSNSILVGVNPIKHFSIVTKAP